MFQKTGSRNFDMRSFEFLLPERLIRVNSFTEFVHELNPCMSSREERKKKKERREKSSDQAPKNINESECTICILKPEWS